MESSNQRQSSVEQLERPSLPAKADTSAVASPTTSMLVASPSAPYESIGADDLAPLNASDRPRYGSPPPLSSSMTPPPSSQPPKRAPEYQVDRAITPARSGFCSPPPTVMYGLKREASHDSTYVVPSVQQVETASTVELRELLQASLSEVGRLNAEVREARMSAAHYKLQHNLLSIETDESAKRMEVEHEMTRREVEVLQIAELARREVGSPKRSATARYIAELKVYCEAIDNQNSTLHRRLDQAKKVIAQKDEDLVAVMEENRRFVTRIRENREHLNQLKSPGGIYAAGTPRQSNSGFPVTPQQNRSTPKHTPRSLRQDRGDEQNSFAALLLADQVLNQENNSAPSTPTSSRPHPNNHIRHHRGVHSLSSLPSTPIRPRTLNDHGSLLPSANLQYPQSEPQNRSSYTYFTPQQDRNRKSRDSTISADDAQEMATYNENVSDDEEVQESQASQTASAMLRRDPRESMEVVRTPTPTTAAEKSGLLQAKIFGSVTKTGYEKRKRVEESVDYDVKKARVGNGGIGLGINSWS